MNYKLLCDCGNLFTVNATCSDVDRSYKCPKCGTYVEASFFGYCSSCNNQAAFKRITGLKMVASLGLNMLTGCTTKVTDTIGMWFDDAKGAEKVGECSCCETVALKCNNCGKAFSVDFSYSNSTKVYECKHCGTKQRVCSYAR